MTFSLSASVSRLNWLEVRTVEPTVIVRASFRSVLLATLRDSSKSMRNVFPSASKKWVPSIFGPILSGAEAVTKELSISTLKLSVLLPLLSWSASVAARLAPS